MSDKATTFTTTIQQAEGMRATGIVVPAEAVAALGGQKQPLVVVTLNGYTYRSKVAVRGGDAKVPVSAAHREAAGLAAGDEVVVTLTLDTAPREVAVPDDFASALDAEPKARAFFDGLSNSQKRWFVDNIEGAKQADTRARRIVKAVERLASGRGVR